MCVSSVSYGQVQDSTVYDVEELPQIDSLRNSLGDYYKSQAVYEIGVLTYVEKWKWLKYTPSFGWNMFQNTPVIGWNSNDLYAAINAKRAKKAKIQSIVNRINLEYEKNCKILALEYDLYTSKRLHYEKELAVLDLHKQLMELYEDQYKRHEITPSNYLTKKISFANIVSTVTERKHELDRMRVEILGLSFFGDRVTLLNSEDVTGN